MSECEILVVDRTGRRRGFAIVLVAGLAGLIFLLGAALVAVSQLHSFATQYDQRMQLARDNARAALDIAVGELQKYAGQDQVATLMSDALRSVVEEDFNLPSPVESSGLYNAFWTGVNVGLSPNPSSIVWLVTKPLSSDFDSNGSSDTALPSVDYVDSVTLVGVNTAQISAGSKQSLHNVKVPKEEIVVSGVEGYSSDVAIGHYAYWVGDLASKASYAVYDKSASIGHDIYANNETNGLVDRLNQMQMREPNMLPGYDQHLTEPNIQDNNPNPNEVRIDEFVNDFQLRDKIGDSAETYFIGLHHEYVQRKFHDFTPLSRGLLTDAKSGGVKKDLSALGTVSNSGYDTYLLPQVEIPSNGLVSFSSNIAAKFKMTAADSALGHAAIFPALTQFNINFRVWVDGPDLLISHNAGFEFWNPYTSSLEKQALQIKVLGLPTVDIEYTTGIGTGSTLVLQRKIQLSKIEKFTRPPVYSVPTGELDWRPGQITVFSGPAATVSVSDSETVSPYPLVETPGASNVVGSKLVLDSPFVVDAEISENDTLAVKFASPTAIKIGLYESESNGGDLITTFELSGENIKYDLDKTIFPDPYDADSVRFGFSWELSDAAVTSNKYHPSNPVIDKSMLFGWKASSLDYSNLSTSFNDTSVIVDVSNTYLLAENHTADSTIDPSFDLPVMELPAGEVTALSQLRYVYGSKGTGSAMIGEPDAELNPLFDQVFFSSIPQSGTDWELPDPLPISNYMVEGANLFVHGMFNVHSTSIEAWKSLLKSNSASASTFWKKEFEDIEDDKAEGGDDGNDDLSSELYLFFNYPSSARETFDLDFSPSGTGAGVDQSPNIRHSYRQGVIALTEAQVDALAVAIVRNIRQRVQGVGTYVSPAVDGPFNSIEDFLDSRVLKNAIAAVDSDTVLNDPVNPDWVEPGSAREFSQATLLNLLAPYISVRSDTFLVRAYGDACDPADPSKVWARAFCEAIVQRVYEKHPSDANHTDVLSKTSTGTGEFGRQFRIVAFRWMAPSEI